MSRRWLLVVAVLLLSPLAAMAAQSTPNNSEIWEAEHFPVSLTYDRDVWGGRSTSSFEGDERLQLSARATTFTMQLFTVIGGNATDCLTSYLERISTIDAVSNFVEDERRDYPDGIRGADDILVTYDFLWPGRTASVGMIQYLLCVDVDENGLMLIGIETRTGIYEEEIEIINGILGGIDINA